MFGGVENPGGHMDGLSCIYMVEPERYVHDEKRLMVEEKMMAKEKTTTFKNCNKTTSCSSSSTSSIGKNSDVSGISLDNNNVSEDTEDEVQSSYKSPLDAMQALEDVLPIRKGISRFYNGKSKSFASLADAASSKELTKPDNAYAKRRRNLLAYTMSWDKPTRSNSILRSNNGGIAKRVPSATRNSLALAVAMNSLAESSSSDSLHYEHEMAPRSSPPSSCSRVHPRVRLLQTDCSAPPRGSFSAWRSYSHADLQECSSETTIAPTRKTEIVPR